jgi:thiamine-phosphate pyrophosphorylase
MVLRGGADILQLREKEGKDSEVLDLARELAELAHRSGALFIVNDRPDIARLAGADGVHLGQTDLPPAAARAVLGPEGIIGLSTHNVEQARQAVADGVDYIGVGPMFPTATKGYAEGLGPRYIRDAASVADRPLVAIGGITPERIPELLAAAPGRRLIIAVSSAVLKAPDVEAAVRQLKKCIVSHGMD